MVYLDAVAFSRSIRRFGPTHDIIVIDFHFFCRDSIEAKKISLYSLVCIRGGTDQIHARGTAIRCIDGWMAVDVRAL